MSSSDAGGVRGQVRRADKVMSEADIDQLLCSAFCGRTASVGHDGFPYLVPNLFVWHERSVWLHTAKSDGHFARNVAQDDRVCFEVDAPGEVFPYGSVECDTSVSYRSVVLFGRIRRVADPERARGFFSLFMKKYAPADSWGREQGSFPRLGMTHVYCIQPESITGKVGVLPGIESRWQPKNNTISAAQAASSS